MRTFWENSGIEAVASFEDEVTKEPRQPDTVHWKLYCETTRKALTDFTPVSVAAVTDSFGNTTAYSSEIDIPGSLNVIQNDRNATEIKALTIVADKDTPREYSDVHRYAVRRNRAR